MSSNRVYLSHVKTPTHFLLTLFIFVLVTHLSPDYQEDPQQVECLKCPTGYYESETGQSQSCTNCPSGWWGWGDGGNITCSLQTKCVAGEYKISSGSTLEDRNCSKCEIAKYSSIIDVKNSPGSGNRPVGNSQGGGVSSCELCTKGKYQDTTGQSQCKFW